MRDRIARWKVVFDTDDNAITKALSRMAWDLAAFTCFVEILRRAPDDGAGKRFNLMIFEMVTSGFWSGTMQGVRRLAEREAVSGAYGVCSLGGLVQDVKAVRPRLTRRVFVEDIAGLNYNYLATRGRRLNFMLARTEGGATWIPREFDDDQSEQRHAEFDAISGTTPGTSTDNDLIREDVFDALERRLAGLNGVVEHVNVEIAHAATEASRHGRVLERWGLDDAKSAIRELAQVAQLVGNWFCFSGIGAVLPYPHFDQFQHLNQPIFNGNTDALRAIWDELETEISQWHNVDHRSLQRP